MTLRPLEAHSCIAILHASVLTFSNPSLKVVCSSVCGLHSLWRRSRLSECTSALHWVTYKAIVLKEPYNLLYLMHGDISASSLRALAPIGWWDPCKRSTSLGCFAGWKLYSGDTKYLKQSVLGLLKHRPELKPARNNLGFWGFKEPSLVESLKWR